MRKLLLTVLGVFAVTAGAVMGEAEFRPFLDVVVGYDSNVNLAPPDDAIGSGFLQVGVGWQSIDPELQVPPKNGLKWSTTYYFSDAAEKDRTDVSENILTWDLGFGGGERAFYFILDTQAKTTTSVKQIVWPIKSVEGSINPKIGFNIVEPVHVDLGYKFTAEFSLLFQTIQKEGGVPEFQRQESGDNIRHAVNADYLQEIFEDSFARGEVEYTLKDFFNVKSNDNETKVLQTFQLLGGFLQTLEVPPLGPITYQAKVGWKIKTDDNKSKDATEGAGEKVPVNNESSNGPVISGLASYKLAPISEKTSVNLYAEINPMGYSGKWKDEKEGTYKERSDFNFILRLTLKDNSLVDWLTEELGYTYFQNGASIESLSYASNRLTAGVHMGF
ncbi:MAG: hypothetical protein ACUVXI_00380 [bacterium]